MLLTTSEGWRGAGVLEYTAAVLHRPGESVQMFESSLRLFVHAVRASNVSDACVGRLNSAIAPRTPFQSSSRVHCNFLDAVICTSTL